MISSIELRGAPLAPSFPGSAWERTAPEAPPRDRPTDKLIGRIERIRPIINRIPRARRPSFPGSAWERTAPEAPPRDFPPLDNQGHPNASVSIQWTTTAVYAT